MDEVLVVTARGGDDTPWRAVAKIGGRPFFLTPVGLHAVTGSSQVGEPDELGAWPCCDDPDPVPSPITLWGCWSCGGEVRPTMGVHIAYNDPKAQQKIEELLMGSGLDPLTATLMAVKGVEELSELTALFPLQSPEEGVPWV